MKIYILERSLCYLLSVFSCKWPLQGCQWVVHGHRAWLAALNMVFAGICPLTCLFSVSAHFSHCWGSFVEYTWPLVSASSWMWYPHDLSFVVNWPQWLILVIFPWHQHFYYCKLGDITHPPSPAPGGVLAKSLLVGINLNLAFCIIMGKTYTDNHGGVWGELRRVDS